jgi:hypothetical protein
VIDATVSSTPAVLLPGASGPSQASGAAAVPSAFPKVLPNGGIGDRIESLMKELDHSLASLNRLSPTDLLYRNYTATTRWLNVYIKLEDARRETGRPKAPPYKIIYNVGTPPIHVDYDSSKPVSQAQLKEMEKARAYLQSQVGRDPGPSGSLQVHC